MAGYVPLEIEQNADFSRTITIRNSDGTTKNLVSYTANTVMKKSFYSTSSNTITTTISDGANGVISMSMTGANTGLLSPGRYWYDVVSTSPGGAKQRLIEGIVVVNPGVAS